MDVETGIVVKLRDEQFEETNVFSMLNDFTKSIIDSSTKLFEY